MVCPISKPCTDPVSTIIYSTTPKYNIYYNGKVIASKKIEGNFAATSSPDLLPFPRRKSIRK